MLSDFEIQQWERYDGDEWWQWAVWLEGSDEQLDQVKYVEWVLHSTFPNPLRKVSDRGTKFRLETGGWGVFRIHARVHMKEGRDIRLHHDLQLHYDDNSNNTN